MSDPICPFEGDMSECKKKPRCKWGECEGQSLPSDGDNCPTGYYFREDYCDCFPDPDSGCYCNGTAELKWKATVDSYTGDCVPTTTNCSAFGDSQYTTIINDVAVNTVVELTTGPSSGIGSCSGTQNTTVYANYVTCAGGTLEPRSILIGTPGCSVNTSTGANATPTDTQVTYYSGNAGWGFTTTQGDVKYYSSQCVPGGTSTGGAPYYTPISGSWANVVAVQRTSPCDGYYWEIEGTTCDGNVETIDTIGCCTSGFSGVAEGSLVVTIESP